MAMRTMRTNSGLPGASLLIVLLASCGTTSSTASSGAHQTDSGSATAEFREAHGPFLRRAIADAPIQLRTTWLPNAHVGGEPGEFDATDFELDAVLPLPLDRDSFLIMGALAGVRRVQFEGVQTVSDETLYRGGLRLGYGRFISDDLVVQGYWQPSLYSDLDGNLEGDDYKLWYGTALAVYRETDDLFWKLGFRLTDAIDTGAIPLAGISWHFKPGWQLEVLLPRNADVRYSPNKKWTISSGFLVSGDEYHIRGPASLGKPEHNVHVQELAAVVRSEYRLTDNLSVDLKIGSTIAGQWDWSYGGGVPRYDGSLQPGLFLQWGLGWRF